MGQMVGPRPTNLNGAHRHSFLLSGLLQCGRCGGAYTITGKDRYGCATAKQKGTCSNRVTLRRQEIEGRLLKGIKHGLLAPDLVAQFVEDFRAEMAKLSIGVEI